MGNQTVKSMYQKYIISQRLFSYLMQFESWIENCKPHPYHNSVKNLYQKVVNEIIKLAKHKYISSETETKFITRLKEIENIIEKHSVCKIKYMDIEAEVKSNLTDKMYIFYNNAKSNTISDFISNIEYIDYTELYFVFDKKMVAFNQVGACPDLVKFINLAFEK